MHKPAQDPNDLEKFFVQRANTGDLEGLVALYEPGAVLAAQNGEVFDGEGRIREFFMRFLAEQSRLAPSVQAAPLINGRLSLTASRHSDGLASAEIARRQDDGSWLWVVDRFAIK